MDQFLIWFHALLDLGEQHGLSVVLLFGGIIAWVLTVRWAGKKFDALWDSWLKMKGMFPDPEIDNVESMVIFNVKVRGCLQDMMAELNADWCQLWQFHNGAHGVGKTRIPFVFLTLTNEVNCPNCQPMVENFAQLPLAMFSRFATELITQELLIHSFRNDDAEVTSMGQMMHNFGANLGFIRAIRDEDNRVIGFVTVAWKDNSKTVTEKRKTQFMNGVQRMAAILATVEQKRLEKERR